MLIYATFCNNKSQSEKFFFYRASIEKIEIICHDCIENVDIAIDSCVCVCYIEITISHWPQIEFEYCCEMEHFFDAFFFKCDRSWILEKMQWIEYLNGGIHKQRKQKNQLGYCMIRIDNVVL